MWKAQGSLRDSIKWIAGKLWDWNVVAWGSAFIAGAGIAALYGDDYVLAAVLFLMAVAWIVIKAMTWEEVRNQPHRKVINSLILFGGTVLFVCSLWWIAHRRQLNDGLGPRIEGLPGFSGNLVIKLIDAPKVERQYIFDLADREGAGVSAYISASNLFTFLVTDVHGETYPLEVELSGNGVAPGRWSYIECEAGIGKSGTIMAVFVDGQEVSNRVIQGQLDLGDRDWRFGTFGADRQNHKQFGSFSLAEFAIYTSTFTADDQKQMNRYIKQKYALKLK